MAACCGYDPIRSPRCGFLGGSNLLTKIQNTKDMYSGIDSNHLVKQIENVLIVRVFNYSSTDFKFPWRSTSSADQLSLLANI